MSLDASSRPCQWCWWDGANWNECRQRKTALCALYSRHAVRCNGVSVRVHHAFSPDEVFVLADSVGHTVVAFDNLDELEAMVVRLTVENRDANVLRPFGGSHVGKRG